MSDPQPDTTIDISGWVRKAKADPVKYRQRQVTDILLNAVALTPQLGSALYLKGGILMALAYGSPRTTADIDFSADSPPEAMAAGVRNLLDGAFRRAAALRGYPDLLCRVQTIKHRPRPDNFAEATAPALKLTIGSARRGTPEEGRLDAGQASHTVAIDISFKEPIETMQRLVISNQESVQAYGLHDLIAEKLRAILQQKTRPHPGERRQDIYDIALLLQKFCFDPDELAEILSVLRIKSRERDIEPDRSMIVDPVIIQKLRNSWPTLQSELEDPLPDFDGCFAAVRDFYKSLPWD